MALEIGGDRERVEVYRALSGRLGCQSARREHAGDDGGRRRAESAGLRNRVDAAHRHTGYLDLQCRERRVHGADHQMVRIARQVVNTFTRDRNRHAVGCQFDLDLVVPIEREAERIEAGPEVGTRRRHGDEDGLPALGRSGVRDAHPSPSAEAAARTSAGTTSGRISP